MTDDYEGFKILKYLYSIYRRKNSSSQESQILKKFKKSPESKLLNAIGDLKYLGLVSLIDAKYQITGDGINFTEERLIKKKE